MQKACLALVFLALGFALGPLIKLLWCFWRCP